jgi:hypothetical protein
LDCHGASYNEFVTVHGLLDRKEQLGYRVRQLVRDCCEERIPSATVQMATMEEEGCPQSPLVFGPASEHLRNGGFTHTR